MLQQRLALVGSAGAREGKSKLQSQQTNAENKAEVQRVAPPHAGSRTKDIDEDCQCVIVGGGHLIIPVYRFLEAFFEAVPRFLPLFLVVSHVLGCDFFTCLSVCPSVRRVVDGERRESRLMVSWLHMHQTHESCKPIRCATARQATRLVVVGQMDHDVGGRGESFKELR